MFSFDRRDQCTAFFTRHCMYILSVQFSENYVAPQENGNT